MQGDMPSGGRIEARERLVERQQARLMDQRARGRYLLLQSARELFAGRCHLAKRRVRKFSTSRIFGIQPLDRDGRQS